MKSITLALFLAAFSLTDSETCCSTDRVKPNVSDRHPPSHTVIPANEWVSQTFCIFWLQATI